ncbi:hypothetical protein MXB_2986 [Myxobolus squamalis]|nr:hypothetical protein MXB_2986 [Myxobolus squamalis]
MSEVATATVIRTKRSKIVRNTLDCTRCVEDKLFDISSFADYLKSRFKVKGKVNNLGLNVIVSASTNKVTVSSDIPYSKRYLKYLAKKFLKRSQLRNWIRVVASSKNVYELRYFNIGSDVEEEEETQE